MDNVPKPATPGREYLAGAAVFLITLAAYWGAPNSQVWDSNYTILLSEQLLWRQSFRLNDYFEPPANAAPARARPANWPYQIDIVDGTCYYWYPSGTSLLAAPLVGVGNALGYSAVGAEDRPSLRGETKMQRAIASIWTAAACLTLFAAARCLLPIAPSLALALAFGLGTSLWSTASRALWSHTATVLLASLIVWRLLAWRTGRRELSPLYLGTLLSWLYFVRPSSSLTIVAVTVYVLIIDRRQFIVLAGVGAAWFALFLGWSLTLHGHPLPSYYRLGAAGSLANFAHAFPGHLLSPSRGLFVYSPMLALVVGLAIAVHRRLPDRGLARLAGVVIAAHVLVLSSWPCWWGGACYGPRLLTDVLPWFALLGMLVLRTVLDGAAHRSWADARPWLAAALVAVSVGMHAVGAFSRHAMEWNRRVDADRAALWDWRQPPFLAFRATPAQSPAARRESLASPR